MRALMNKIVTAVGTPNIALVKYWGRRDASLNLPANSSFSLTLDENLHTTTSVLFSDKLDEDLLYVNGVKQDLHDPENEKSAFTGKVIELMRAAARSKSRALIVSKNSFPQSAGFASSASGGAALVVAAAKALGLEADRKQLSIIARQISGSACRSVCGGFVVWRRGEKSDGTDSYAESVAPSSHWPDIVDVIATISPTKKKVSSSEGHRITPETSELYRVRPEIAEGHVKRLISAVMQRDFRTLAEVTMKDSNSMHAVMLDSFPPITYLNDLSHDVIYAVHELNSSEGEPIAAYTFDAGPNAHVITLKKNKERVVDLLKRIVGENIIVAGLGGGPRVAAGGEALIDQTTLKPKGI